MRATRFSIAVGVAVLFVAGGTFAVISLADPPAAEAEPAGLAVAETGLIEPDAITGVCGVTNGFTVTALSGVADCEAALAMSTAYTRAVLTPGASEELGSGLFWAEEGWVCSRNYDDSVALPGAFGLYCQRGTAIVTLVSE
ncbi:MAG: hypothetical protein LBB58_04230 [Cellulomonadaceae bacterium]|jgi:hypothetical protein|nr:hypothetical protein [Cellulomonadaceae bacterium]